MGMSEDDFYHSSLAKVVYLIDVWADEQKMKTAALNSQHYKSKYFDRPQETKTVQSLKEILGGV
ncbi:MAG TPA: hypothetical protein DHW61_16025 [Lachnoclostridium phytofermentans]|uniref:Uncharacterized protein n=1 Tax=Lachnoclostridium phytofermentans TaxID=66219 RepID=A0A3D2XC31_9FIRM|nr:hypothetical protein [Lachnoclostridium phytofermentans]